MGGVLLPGPTWKRFRGCPGSEEASSLARARGSGRLESRVQQACPLDSAPWPKGGDWPLRASADKGVTPWVPAGLSGHPALNSVHTLPDFSSGPQSLSCGSWDPKPLTLPGSLAGAPRFSSWGVVALSSSRSPRSPLCSWPLASLAGSLVNQTGKIRG